MVLCDVGDSWKKNIFFNCFSFFLFSLGNLFYFYSVYLGLFSFLFAINSFFIFTFYSILVDFMCVCVKDCNNFFDK